MTRLEGHLFVAHGLIEEVVHDAAIVPGGERLKLRSWRRLVGDHFQRPPEWSRLGVGRIHSTPEPVWGVNVAGAGGDYDRLLKRIATALEDIAENPDGAQIREGNLPLVAMPVIGIGEGGFSEQRGVVLRKLVDMLIAQTRQLSLDVVLITPDRAVYAAAQHARKSGSPRLPPPLEEHARHLGEQAQAGELALLLGAGVSAAAGLPGWATLISDLAQKLKVREPANVEALSLTDRAELIELTAADSFRQSVADMIRTHERPSLLHALLAGLDCREVVTTNYDVLYEKAVQATGRSIESVMPWASAQGADRWILKLHGDVNHHDKIVLTRRHMTSYDAANRPSAALLQSLLLTKRLLVVGVSMTDDNVIRLAYEVDAYRKEHQGGRTGTVGTVFDSSGDALRSQLWAGQFDWINLPDLGPWPGRRGVELLLDRVALHGSRDSSWLLDERFEGLLESRDDLELAKKARELYQLLPSDETSKWSPLVRMLGQFGADGQGPAALHGSRQP